MKVFINGEPFGLEPQQHNLAAVLTRYLGDEHGKQSFAVAVNGDFIAKAEYQDTQLNGGDSIDLLFPIQGG